MFYEITKKVIFMDFMPDYDVARNELANTVFGTYSQAYTVTNEDLRQTMRFMPEKCENALVVAASGDHPLFCSLYGAENVDTFDISYNAKCIMDIKNAALNTLSYQDYICFIKDLYNVSVPLMDVKNMSNVLYKLPKTEFDYVYALKDVQIFMRKLISLNSAVLPTQFEYDKLRENVKAPYNFILTDICRIGGKLTKSYDFMHLSNVFDYVQSFHYEHIILSLMEHVRPGGRIITQFFAEGNDTIFGFRMTEMAKKHKNWIFGKKTIINTGKFDYNKNGIYVIERVR